MRAVLVLAILDTFKIHDELLKKTIPTLSLLQVKARVKHLDLKALAGSKHDLRVGLIAKSHRGRNISFEKIIKMIDYEVVLPVEQKLMMERSLL